MLLLADRHRPWASGNISKRSEIHMDYCLVKRFMEHVATIRLKISIMENVPPSKAIKDLESKGQELLNWTIQ